MRIPNYKKFGDLQIDPKLVEAMQKAAEQMMNDARRTENPYSSFDQVPFYHECYNFKQDLTTSQKMRAFKFIKAIETAKEL